MTVDAQSSTGESERQAQPDANPFRAVEQLAGLLASFDPIAIGAQAIDGTRRVVELTMATMENFASTVDNLNRTTTRINALLDDIESPLKRVMPQVGSAMNTVATLGETAAALTEIAKRLSPLASIAENAGGLFGLRATQRNPEPSGGVTSS